MRINKVFDRLLVVIGALFFIQCPLFIHQYQMQLTGHVNELQRQVNAIHEVAKKSEKNLDQYIQKFIDNPDRDFSRQGALMHALKMRYEKLSKALSSLQTSSIFTKPCVFLFYLQGDIAFSTAKSFEPGISFTIEEAIYAFIGMINGYLFFKLLESLCRNFLSKRRPVRKEKV